jgi:hypothetical protein
MDSRYIQIQQIKHYPNRVKKKVLTKRKERKKFKKENQEKKRRYWIQLKLALLYPNRK